MNIGPVTILMGDAADRLREVPDGSVDVICTSPPFFNLRSYLSPDDPAKADEIGSEAAPEAFLARLMAVFDECRRVLKPTGTCWVEFGDSYGEGTHGTASFRRDRADCAQPRVRKGMDCDPKRGKMAIGQPKARTAGEMGNIPHRFAEAMRAHQWRWRSTCIWVHRSAMPESLGGWRWGRCRVKVSEGEYLGRRDPARGDIASSAHHPKLATWQPCPGCDKCRDTGGYVLRKGQWRCTTGHSYVFQFAKSERYFCDASAAAEPAAGATIERNRYTRITGTTEDEQYSVQHDHEFSGATRNPRTVWLDIGNEPQDMDVCLSCGRVWRTSEKKGELQKRGKSYVCTCGASNWGSHYAAFPRALARKCLRPCISKAGCCPTCGVPWSPIIEKSGGTIGKSWHDHADDEELGQRASNDAKGGSGYAVTSLGYRQSCRCQPHKPVPQTILDPFCGTGTVAVVAAEMGLKAIGIELNKHYLPLVERRVREVLVPRGQARALDSAGPLFNANSPDTASKSPSVARK